MPVSHPAMSRKLTNQRYDRPSVAVPETPLERKVTQESEWSDSTYSYKIHRLFDVQHMYACSSP